MSYIWFVFKFCKEYTVLVNHEVLKIFGKYTHLSENTVSVIIVLVVIYALDAGFYETDSFYEW